MSGSPFGRALAAARREEGITQAELAIWLHLGKAGNMSVSKWERGIVEPSRTHWQKLTARYPSLASVNMTVDDARGELLAKAAGKRTIPLATMPPAEERINKLPSPGRMSEQEQLLAQLLKTLRHGTKQALADAEAYETEGDDDGLALYASGRASGLAFADAVVRNTLKKAGLL